MKRILFVLGLALTLLVGCKKSNDVKPKNDYTDLKVMQINSHNNDYTYNCYRESKNDTCYIIFSKVITPDPNSSIIYLSYYDGWIYEPLIDKYIRYNKVKIINFNDIITDRIDFLNMTTGSTIRLGFTF